MMQILCKSIGAIEQWTRSWRVPSTTQPPTQRFSSIVEQKRLEQLQAVLLADSQLSLNYLVLILVLMLLHPRFTV